MKKTILIIFLTLVLLLSCACGADRQEETQPVQSTQPEQTEAIDETQESKPLAPDFTVYDIDGNPVKLSDFVGTPVVLNFWASWCGPCKSEMPDFDKAYAEYGDRIQFMMVNLTDGTQETVETASGLIADLGYSFPVFYDTDMDAATAYGIYSIPTTYFIDAEGCAVAYGSGAMDMEMVEKGIAMLLP